jgi:hypothetical protein
VLFVKIVPLFGVDFFRYSGKIRRKMRLKFYKGSELTTKIGTEMQVDTLWQFKHPTLLNPQC